MNTYPRMTLVLALLVAAGGVGSSTTALARGPASPTTTSKGASAKMDALLRSLTKKGQFQGTVLVAKKGSVLLRHGYGTANAAMNLKNQPETRFSIGSMTKQFTAMAVLQLQESGKLTVNDPVCRYLPNCPAGWQPITLHMLLTHTSGIPDFPNRSIDFSKPMAFDRILALLQHEPLDFTPGARWSYSNSGYDLLGAVIERVSGESWASYLHHHIFDPLGMKHTGVDDENSTDTAHAVGYRTILGKTPLPTSLIDPSLILAAGALYSTVGDLYTWDQALSTDKLVSKKSLDAMFTPYVQIGDAGSTYYGYGWFLDDSYKDHRVLFHAGTVLGFESMNVLVPSDGLTVIVLSNEGTADANDIGLILAQMALGVNPGVRAA